MGNISSRFFSDARNRWQAIFNSKLRKADLTWVKIRQLKYLAENQKSVYSLKGRKVYFNNGIELLHSLREIFIGDVYKIKLNDTNKPYILDCGANIGLSIVYLKQQFPTARIIGFEPDSVNYAMLQKNIEGFTDINIVKKAVWKANTILSFAGSGTLSSKIEDKEPSDSSEQIEATRLRDYLTEPVDFLKLDIEGAEYEVIKDCAEKLNVVKNLFIEYHGRFNKIHELNEILTIVTNAGFVYYLKEAAAVYPTPFSRDTVIEHSYDVQLNIFCFRNHS